MVGFGMGQLADDAATRASRTVLRRPIPGCRLVVVSCAVAAMVALPRAIGDQPSRSVENTVSLAHVVPATVGLFVELDRIIDDGPTDRARSVYGLYDLLIDPTKARRDRGDWGPTLLRSLGLQAGRGIKELLTHQIAVAAPSWNRLAEGVIVVRLGKDDRLIHDTFGPDSIQTIDRKGDVQVYRTHTRLSAATNGRILVISQRNHDGSVYKSMIRQMQRGTGNTLADNRAYQRQVRDLPVRRDGTIYVRFDETDGGARGNSLFDLGLARLAIGISFTGDNVEFAVRAARSRPAGQEVPRVTSVSRLRSLPLTTIAAWSTQFDVLAAYRSVVQGRLGDDTPPYVELLLRILDVKQFEKDVIDALGNNAIIAWDQNLGAGPNVPQLAILLESNDADRCATSFAESVQVVVDWFDVKNRDKPQRRLRLTRTEYLGTTIFEVTLPAKDDGRGGATLPAEFIKPAFAAMEDTFIVAFSADHIRNIVDAKMGLAPTLRSLRDFASVDQDNDPAFLLGIVQPAVAAQTVDGWLNDANGPMNRWFAQAIGGAPSYELQSKRTPKLGIGTQAGERPGTVLVARVYHSGRAAGHLRLGDLILGVNNTLVSLDHPTADLRRLMVEGANVGQWTFRVEREGKVIEVSIPCPRLARSTTDPTRALRQLQAMFRRLDFGSIRAVETSPDRFDANMTLRFTADTSRG